jgi:SAM-dependent methyltransferase
VLCLSVLEHVDDPFAAMREMRRVLRVGGLLVLHVPFLYPYHAQPGYYGDFFRFTEEGVRVLGRAFSRCDLEPTGGRLAATAVVSPLARFGLLRRAADSLDAALSAWRASTSPQARGYLARLVR